jgi:hypothetical protein
MGITSDERMIEAFIATHRGSQYINAQLLSCRAHLDIALPFCDAELLELACALPLSQKIHNSVDREILRRHAPELLSVACAATLVPASAPIGVQEATRALRRALEAPYGRLARAAPSLLPPLRLGWVNFDFLRSGAALGSLEEDLRCDIWDRAALRVRIADARDPVKAVATHPLSDQMMKIYTSDLMLRG